MTERRGIEGDMFDGPEWEKSEPRHDRMPSRDETHYTAEYKAAADYLRAVGLDPKPDAVEQLVLAFTPSLKLICERDYHPEGATWQRAGRKGLMREILKYADRMRDRDWLRDNPDQPSAEDMINYCGFYIRAILKNMSDWGFWGEPSSQVDGRGR
jgi:hypothetical protein